MERYEAGSLTLAGAVALGTGVMIGAGIFALLGQVAELAGAWFPIAFVLGAVVTAFSAYSYVKLSNAFPSAGGIAMFLEKAYGKGIFTSVGALLMAFSMVINESLVARTFGSYTIQLFQPGSSRFWIPFLGVLLLTFAFLINISGNRLIGTFSKILAIVKIGGIAVFALAGLWVSGLSWNAFSGTGLHQPVTNYLGAIALSILAYKGFTTITNSGSEIVNPHRNVGRAIVLSLVVCAVIYALVAVAVSGNLTLPEIIKSKDYALAEAARPAFGDFGLWFTVGLAIIATVSGVIASIFAVSRMLAMLTDMHLIPHRHFGMPGTIQKHTLVYTVVIAILLTVFFDLSRIASLGAIFYLLMDIMIHWGVLRYLRKEIKANAFILMAAMGLDAVILGAFVWVKASADIMVIAVSSIIIVLIFLGETLFLKPWRIQKYK